jgi:hypothetical protein
MRHGAGWLLIVGLWLAWVMPALAQSGTVRIIDPDGVLQAPQQVQTAADALAAEGAEVIVVAAGASGGTSESSALQFLDQTLDQQNLAPGVDQLQPDQIVFYVAADARLTGLYYGARWLQTLDPVQDVVRDERMTPEFANGNFEAGFVAGITTVRETINPPPPDRTPLYIGAGVLALAAAGAAAVPVVRRRRQAADALSLARQRMQQAQQAAGAAIADLGLRIRDAQAKAAYDRVSYTPEQAAQLQQTQAEGMALFEQSQSVFDAADEARKLANNPTVADYDRIAAQFDQARELAERAATIIGSVNTQRAELDRQHAPQTSSES